MTTRSADTTRSESAADDGDTPGKSNTPGKSHKVKASPEEVAASTWLAAVLDTFAIDHQVLRANIKDILDLISYVAHTHSRPAAPVTAFLVGLAAGKSARGQTAEELNLAVRTCLEQLPHQVATPGSETHYNVDETQ